MVTSNSTKVTVTNVPSIKAQTYFLIILLNVQIFMRHRVCGAVFESPCIVAHRWMVDGRLVLRHPSAGCRSFAQSLMYYSVLMFVCASVCSIRSVMQKHLEKMGEVAFEKIFNQKLGISLSHYNSNTYYYYYYFFALGSRDPEG